MNEMTVHEEEGLMANDLYERCPECAGPRTLGVCGRCQNQWYVPVGVTLEELDHAIGLLDRGAPMMTALRAEVTRLTRERDALIDLHIHRSIVVSDELWDVLLPDSCSPFGFSWTQDIETRAEAVAMLLKAIGLEESKS